MTTITTTGATFTPAVVRDYSVSQDSGNQVHQLLGGGVDVTIRPASLRKGTLNLLFLSTATAEACRAAHATGVVFHLSEPGMPSVAMDYVLDGRLELERDSIADDGWWLAVEYHEVPA